MKVLLPAVVMLGVLAVTAWGAYYMWTNIAGELTGHGWVAMILGVVFTTLVGTALMALVFYSSRHGHDEPPDFRG